MGIKNSDESSSNSVKKKIGKKLVLRMITILLIVIVGMFAYSFINGLTTHKEIITVSSLEEIINISDLNTYQAVYNGVAEVINEKKENKIDCYVSYEAKVNAGFDFEEVRIVKEDEPKRIIVTIPKIEISEVNVDIGSLDYMYLEKVSDDEMITKRAYKACIADVEDESKNEIEIYELAEQNAINIVEALISPFIQQFGPEYELVIKGEQ